MIFKFFIFVLHSYVLLSNTFPKEKSFGNQQNSLARFFLIFQGRIWKEIGDQRDGQEWQEHKVRER